MSDSSVCNLIGRIQQEDSQAARDLWERFIEKLCLAARTKLRNLPRRAIDEEDVALSAFNSFFQGVKEGRFRKLEDEEDLWQVLAMLTERKAIATLRRELAQKRGGGRIRGDSVFQNMLGDSTMAGGIANIGDPSRDAVDGFTENVRDLLELLQDHTQRKIALLKLGMHTNSEIAQELNISLRSVERKAKLIRDKWEAELKEEA